MQEETMAQCVKKITCQQTSPTLDPARHGASKPDPAPHTATISLLMPSVDACIVWLLRNCVDNLFRGHLNSARYKHLLHDLGAVGVPTLARSRACQNPCSVETQKCLCFLDRLADPLCDSLNGRVRHAIVFVQLPHLGSG